MTESQLQSTTDFPFSNQVHQTMTLKSTAPSSSASTDTTAVPSPSSASPPKINTAMLSTSNAASGAVTPIGTEAHSPTAGGPLSATTNGAISPGQNPGLSRSSNASPHGGVSANNGSPASQSDLFVGSVPFGAQGTMNAGNIRGNQYGISNPIGSMPATVTLPNGQPAFINKSINLGGLTVTPLGPGFDPAPQRPVNVTLRRLPPGTTNEHIKLILLFLGDDLVEIDDLQSSDDGEFVSALLTLRSRVAADTLLRNLNNKMNSKGTSLMLVDVPSTANTPTQQGRGVSPTGSRSLLQTSVPFNAAQTNGATGQQNVPPAGISVTPIQEIPEGPGESIITFLGFNNVENLAPGQLPNGQRRATLSHINAQQLPALNNQMVGLSLNTNFSAANLANYAANNSALSPLMARNPPPPMTATGVTTHPMSFSSNNSTNGANGTANAAGQTNQFRRNSNYPSANPADQNPPCNTLYVGNLPQGTTEDELKSAFSGCKGYKRLCYRVKSNGPMCFVEFDDVPSATKCLKDMYGFLLPRSNKHGIRLSFSKNPLGVRSNATPTPSAMAGSIGHSTSPFGNAGGPPPGLAAPPGLNVSVPTGVSTGSRNGTPANGIFLADGTPVSATVPQSASGFYSSTSTVNPWNTNVFAQTPIGAPAGAASFPGNFIQLNASQVQAAQQLVAQQMVAQQQAAQQQQQQQQQQQSQAPSSQNVFAMSR